MYRHILISAFLLTSICSANTFRADQVQDLPQTENKPFLDGLKAVLHSQSYPEKYQEKEFDCLDTCRICLQVLQEAGYQPRVMARLEEKGAPGESHCWLAVPDGDEWAFVETTIYAFDPGQGLGGIIPPGDAQGYDEGLMAEDAEEFFRCWSL